MCYWLQIFCNGKSNSERIKFSCVLNENTMNFDMLPCGFIVKKYDESEI